MAHCNHLDEILCQYERDSFSFDAKCSFSVIGDVSEINVEDLDKMENHVGNSVNIIQLSTIESLNMM